MTPGQRDLVELPIHVGTEWQIAVSWLASDYAATGRALELNIGLNADGSSPKITETASISGTTTLSATFTVTAAKTATLTAGAVTYWWITLTKTGSDPLPFLRGTVPVLPWGL